MDFIILLEASVRVSGMHICVPVYYNLLARHNAPPNLNVNIIIAMIASVPLLL